MMKSLRLCTITLFLCGSVIFSAQAQEIPSKPGLWASASQVSLNGQRAPTLFDVQGALSEADKVAMKQVMSQLGLPLDANPSLSCETATYIDLQNIISNMKSQGCTANITEQTADHINYTLDCKTPETQSAGTGSATGINTDTVIYNVELTGTVNGQPMEYKTKTTTKFVGSDCANPPPGIDPSWIGQK